MGLLGRGPVGLCRRQRLVLKVLTERLDSPSTRSPRWAGTWRSCPTSSTAARSCCCWASWSRAWRPRPSCAWLLNRARVADHRPPGRPFAAARLRPRPCCSTSWPWWRCSSPAASCWPASAIRQSIGGICSASRSSRRCSTGAPSTSLFRAWLRPGTPEGRIAPVDDATARGLLIALNWVVVLPLLAAHLGRALLNTGADEGHRERRRHPLRAADRGLPAVGGLALAQRDGGLAVGDGVRPTRSAASSSSTRRAAGGCSASPSTSPDGPGGRLCRPDRERHRRARPGDDRIGAAGAAAVRDADAPRSRATSCRNCRWRATSSPTACA